MDIPTLCQAIRDQVGAAQGHRCEYWADQLAYQEAMVQIMDFDVGPIVDLANQIEGLYSPKPPEPPEPTPERLGCVHGTYQGHGLARDAYPGWDADMVNWGPHHGHPLVAPADGTIEVYRFGTPLPGGRFATVEPIEALGDVYVGRWRQLTEGAVCFAVGQQMIVAVWWPAAPYYVAGTHVGHLHYGHVADSVRTGWVAGGDTFAYSWDSGIRFEPGNPTARAAHVHCCAGSGRLLSPNGDLPGELAIAAQGWAPVTDLRTVPGPLDYQVPNRYTAGRLLSDFTSAGEPLPEMPA